MEELGLIVCEVCENFDAAFVAGTGLGDLHLWRGPVLLQTQMPITCDVFLNDKSPVRGKIAGSPDDFYKNFFLTMGYSLADCGHNESSWSIPISDVCGSYGFRPEIFVGRSGDLRPNR